MDQVGLWFCAWKPHKTGQQQMIAAMRCCLCCLDFCQIQGHVEATGGTRFGDYVCICDAHRMDVTPNGSRILERSAVAHSIGISAIASCWRWSRWNLWNHVIGCELEGWSVGTSRGEDWELRSQNPWLNQTHFSSSSCTRCWPLSFCFFFTCFTRSVMCMSLYALYVFFIRWASGLGMSCSMWTSSRRSALDWFWRFGASARSASRHQIHVQWMVASASGWSKQRNKRIHCISLCCFCIFF